MQKHVSDPAPELAGGSGALRHCCGWEPGSWTDDRHLNMATGRHTRGYTHARTWLPTENARYGRVFWQAQSEAWRSPRSPRERRPRSPMPPATPDGRACAASPPSRTLSPTHSRSPAGCAALRRRRVEQRSRRAEGAHRCWSRRVRLYSTMMVDELRRLGHVRRPR